MNKCCHILYKLINIAYLFFMLVILGICLFGNQMEYSHKKVFRLENWQYVVWGMLFFMIVTWLACMGGKLFRKLQHPDRWMMFMSAIFGAGLVVLSYHYYFKTGWDAQVVEGTAHAIARGEKVFQEYFSYYPNNIFLTFLFSLVIRAGYLLGISNYYFVLIMFQCVLFALTGYLVYGCMRRMLTVSWAVAAWIVYVCFIGISPWVVVPYSDATGLIFPILQVYLYLRIRKDGKGKWYWFFLGIVCYLGYSIKPQTAIAGIAVLMVSFLQFLEKRESFTKKNIITPGFLVGGLAVGIGVVWLGTAATGLEINKEWKMGLPHFFMLGLNEEYNGVINIEDQEFSRQFDTIKERNQANWQVAGSRIRKLGVPGLLKLGRKKILTNFSDGTFAWWEEGGNYSKFHSEEMYDGNYKLRNFLTNYIYEGRPGYETFLSYMQALWMGCLLLAGLGGFAKGKKRETEVLRLSLIGLILFELLFEARARYVFTYAPVFLLLAVLGMHAAVQMMKKN